MDPERGVEENGVHGKHHAMLQQKVQNDTTRPVTCRQWGVERKKRRIVGRDEVMLKKINDKKWCNQESTD